MWGTHRRRWPHGRDRPQDSTTCPKSRPGLVLQAPSHRERGLTLASMHIEIDVDVEVDVDADVDIDVDVAVDVLELRLTVAPRKPGQFCEKQNYLSEIFAENFFWAPKNTTLGIVENTFRQSFAPIGTLFEA